MRTIVSVSIVLAFLALSAHAESGADEKDEVNIVMSVKGPDVTFLVDGRKYPSKDLLMRTLKRIGGFTKEVRVNLVAKPETPIGAIHRLKSEIDAIGFEEVHCALAPEPGRLIRIRFSAADTATETPPTKPTPEKKATP